MNSQNFILSRRIFDTESQRLFAKISGDYNPIHIHPIEARRTTVGQCIVHGVHAVLWPLESYSFLKHASFSEMDISFLKPIYLNEEIICVWDQQKQQLIISSDGALLVRIKIKPEQFPRRVFGAIYRASPALIPENNTFLECEERGCRPFQTHGDCEALREMFPNVAIAYGYRYSLFYSNSILSFKN